MSIAQDVATIIANHVGRQLEEVEGAGMLSDADLKRMQDYYCNLCNIWADHSDYSTGKSLFYTMHGEVQSWENRDQDYLSLIISTAKKTKRVKKEAVITYTVTLELRAARIINGVVQLPYDKIFEKKYTGSDPREWVLGAFEQVYAAMRTIVGKCSACEKYTCNYIAKSYCPECYMNARVKRARTA